MIGLTSVNILLGILWLLSQCSYPFCPGQNFSRVIMLPHGTLALLWKNPWLFHEDFPPQTICQDISRICLDWSLFLPCVFTHQKVIFIERIWTSICWDPSNMAGTGPSRHVKSVIQQNLLLDLCCPLILLYGWPGQGDIRDASQHHSALVVSIYGYFYYWWV